MIAGQREPFPAGFEDAGRALRVTTRRVEIPMHGRGTYVQKLPARRIANTRVNGAPAAVLQAPRFPQGGIHGGHAIVLWNENGHGYLVSAHGQGLAQRDVRAVAVALPRSSI